MHLQEPDFEQRWRRSFNRRGELLNDDADIAGWTRTGLATRVRRFRRLWGATIRPPGLWLDVGCGAGTYSRLLQSEGHSVVGIDYALPSLLKARQRDGTSDIQWAAGDVQGLPLGDNSVDGILCFGVMQALASPHRALAELARVLRPGGELWVDALNAHCAPTLVREWLRRRRHRPAHLRYDTPGEFCDAARQVSLTVENLDWLPILPGRFQGLQWVLEARPVCAMMSAVSPIGRLLSHSFIVRATCAR